MKREAHSAYCFNTIGVVNGKFGVVRSLDGFIDDTIDDSEGVELKLNTLDGAIGNLLVLFVEVVEELLILVQVEATLVLNLLLGHSV
jgi:hypothetical protein